MTRRNRYERAFEALLRSERVPYIAVDEAKRALLPAKPRLEYTAEGEAGATRLKSFDFVVYGPQRHLLVEIKGRKIPAGPARKDGTPRRPTLQTWATRDDVTGLRTWERLFGRPFDAVLVFVYWCDAMPPDGLFERIFMHNGAWFSMRGVLVRDYAASMRTRSPKWGTVDLPAGVFDRISRPVPAGWDGWLEPDRLLEGESEGEPEDEADPGGSEGLLAARAPGVR